jgi:TonB-linked SusC/RagA family outer membrane protein
VSDVQGEPLPGVNIRVQGTTTGTTTDVSGKYSIAAPGEQSVLQFSFIGFTQQDVVVGSQRIVNVTLEEDVKEFDEVVVIGYGSVKRSTLTAAVSKMDASGIENRPLARAETALQGQLAGVVVRTTTGEPGADIQIRVRGAASINASSDPLYVVDGVPLTTLRGINPADIESIEVLKDASSAAIYGSRGSNGVVMVTTKKGKSGKPTISFNASYGVQTMEKKLDVLSAVEWMEFRTKFNDASYLAQAKSKGVTNASIKDSNETRLINTGSTSPNYAYILDDRWFNYMSEATKSAHTYTQTNETLDLLDWQDEFYRNAAVQDYSLSISGGSESTSYLFSAGYFDQDGIATGTKYQRYSIRANIESKINKYITTGINLAPTYIRTDGGGRANGKDARSHMVLASAPVSDAGVGYMTNVEPNLKYLWAGSQTSPIAFMSNSLHDDQIRMMGNAFIRIQPVNGLRVEFSGAANLYDLDRNQYTYSWTNANWASGEGKNSSGGHSTERRWSNLLQAVANYDKTFGKHTVGLMLGTSAEQSDIGFETSQSFNKDLPNDAIIGTFVWANANASSVTEQTPKGVVSYFGRVLYNYDERYLISASLRRDGGSVFGTNNKWGLFPALSAGWNISREQFFTGLNLPWWNTLKLRASYGETGNNAIASDAAFSTLSYGLYSGLSGYNANALGNTDLGWEKARSTDVAIDLGFLANRIQLSFDWYTKFTTDLLYRIPSPSASGFSTVWGNIGNIYNEGFEIELNTANFTGDFKWNTSFNISYNTNEVRKIGDTDTPVYSGFDGSNPSNVLMVGKPINTFYMYDAIGVWKTQKEIDDFKAAHDGKTVTFETKPVVPGDIRYRDVNDDGTFDKEGDQTFMGSPTPKFTYGMTNTFSYKNFDLSILVTAQTGGKIFGVLGRAIDRPSMGASSNIMGHWRNAWWSETEQGDGHTPYILSTTTGTTLDTRWLYSSDYIRIKNLTLGYKIPVKPEILSYARVYISVENLIKWDNYYNGYTTESANSGSSSAPGGGNSLGLDYGAYPLARIFTIGANINF